LNKLIKKWLDRAKDCRKAADKTQNKMTEFCHLAEAYSLEVCAAELNRRWERGYWIDVNKELPQIPAGKYSVSIIVAVYDPVAPVEIKYSVYESIYDGVFKEMVIGQKENSYMEISDQVTHWMPFFKPPEYIWCPG
jgi:hypothetical protein